MITIKTMSSIAYVKEERRLPKSLIEFLEETFKELHEVHDPEVSLNHFSLEMYGPIYVLEADQDETKSLRQIGFCVEESGWLGCHPPEWVENVDLGDYRIWRIGIMPDNSYLFQVILPVNEFGLDVDSWLAELSAHDSRYS